MSDTTPPTRRDLGRVAASQWGEDWRDQLAARSGFNPRSAERLGSAKMPLDARRLLVLAGALLETSPADPGAVHLAAWCVRHARQAIEADWRAAGAEGNPASGNPALKI